MRLDLLCVDELGVSMSEFEGLLDKFNINIVGARNEMEALKLLGSTSMRIGGIVWTINSSDLKDFGAIRRLKANDKFKGIPLIIVSKFTDRRFVIKAIEAGACEYIAKPFDHTLAAKKICNLMGVSSESNKREPMDEDIIVFNFSEMLNREVKLASRGKHPLSILMVSVIPDILDSTGQKNASEVIDIINKIMKLKLRDTDTTFHYGTNYLVFLLPFTDKNGAMIVENKVQNLFETHSVIKQKNDGLRLMVSSVTFPDDGKIKEKLMDKLEMNFMEASKVPPTV